jgi:amino acid adenylation domain-containing protein
VEYNTDLFEEATIDRLLAHYDRLLAAAVAEPDRPLAELDILDQRERQHLLALGTGARLAPATVAEIGLPLESLTLTSLLERQRGLTPHASAVTSEGTTWTYVELHAAADRVAAALRQRGIGREDIVPILVERSLEMMAGLLGILKAGAAYLPLDPEYPPARLAFMIDDAAARVILTQRHLAGRLPETAVPVLRLDAPEDFPAGASGAADVRPEDAAYVIYTSGSTGRPKGVVVEHRSVVNRLLWQREAFPLAPGEAVLQKTPYTFDVSVGELFWPLTAGGRLVMARPGGHRDPDYLVDVVAAERVVSCHFVPSMLRAFLAAVPPARLAACRDLRLVPASGEALTPDLVAAFYRAAAAAGLPDLRLHNLYGPTEATVEVTHWPCPPAGEGALPATVPIGRPLANVRCYVLDPGGHPCPEGVWGELCLAGVQTARGYLNRPELTTERFAADPFFPGERMYRTGDVVRWGPAGAIEYRGRADGQVKLRGFRIEMGEVEAALRAVPGVRDATVVLRTEDTGGPRLVAYVAPLDAPGAAELRTALATSLPDYMLPAAIVPLAALPTTPSGKVDRRALPDPPAPATAGPAAEPASELERLVAAAWAENLGLPRVGPDDNYFDLGGHSLLAIVLHARLRERLQREIPLIDLFAYPTVRAFAAHLAADGDRPDDGLHAAVARATRQRLAGQRAARRPEPR